MIIMSSRHTEPVMRCQRCQGFLRHDGDAGVVAAVCINCGWRHYPPIRAYQLSEARLSVRYCRACEMREATEGKSLCSPCLSARIKRGVAG